MHARVPQSVVAFGERKTLLEWAHDPRCKVSLRELRSRLEKDWAPEEAIAMPTSSKAIRARNFVEAFGEQKSVGEWARDERSQVSALTIAARIQRGWDAEEAITTPVNGRVRPQRERIPRPPSSRRPRSPVQFEPPSNLDADAVRERLASGAELWYAGSSGDRVSLVERETTTIIHPDVLKELQESGELVVVFQTGSVVQYGYKPKVAS